MLHDRFSQVNGAPTKNQTPVSSLQEMCNLSLYDRGMVPHSGIGPEPLGRLNVDKTSRAHQAHNAAFAPQEGIEPPTCTLGPCRSYPLNY